MTKTENYKKAEELVVMGLATKNERDCIDFNIDHDCDSFAWIYPDEDFITICYGEDCYDFGDIDLHRIQVVGCERRYDIIGKEVR